MIRSLLAFSALLLVTCNDMAAATPVTPSSQVTTQSPTLGVVQTNPVVPNTNPEGHHLLQMQNQNVSHIKTAPKNWAPRVFSHDPVNGTKTEMVKPKVEEKKPEESVKKLGIIDTVHGYISDIKAARSEQIRNDEIQSQKEEQAAVRVKQNAELVNAYEMNQAVDSKRPKSKSPYSATERLSNQSEVENLFSNLFNLPHVKNVAEKYKIGFYGKTFYARSPLTGKTSFRTLSFLNGVSIVGYTNDYIYVKAGSIIFQWSVKDNRDRQTTLLEGNALAFGVFGEKLMAVVQGQGLVTFENENVLTQRSVSSLGTNNFFENGVDFYSKEGEKVFVAVTDSEVISVNVVTGKVKYYSHDTFFSKVNYKLKDEIINYVPMVRPEGPLQSNTDVPLYMSHIPKPYPILPPGVTLKSAGETTIISYRNQSITVQDFNGRVFVDSHGTLEVGTDGGTVIQRQPDRNSLGGKKFVGIENQTMVYYGDANLIGGPELYIVQMVSGNEPGEAKRIRGEPSVTGFTRDGQWLYLFQKGVVKVYNLSPEFPVKVTEIQTGISSGALEISSGKIIDGQLILFDKRMKREATLVIPEVILNSKINAYAECVGDLTAVAGLF